MKTGFRPARFFVPIAMVMAVSAGALLAQGRTEETAGSLAALTAEVRQLRLAVEESARRQTQTQAISIYLAAQQSRMVQLSTRLDAVRKELGAAEAASAQFVSIATNMAGDLTQSMPPRSATRRPAYCGCSKTRRLPPSSANNGSGSRRPSWCKRCRSKKPAGVI